MNKIIMAVILFFIVNTAFAKERIEEPYYLMFYGSALESDDISNPGVEGGFYFLMNFPWIQGLTHGPGWNAGETNLLEYNLKFTKFNWTFRYFVNKLTEDGLFFNYTIGGVSQERKIAYKKDSTPFVEEGTCHSIGVGYGFGITKETTMFIQVEGVSNQFELRNVNYMQLSIGFSL